MMNGVRFFERFRPHHSWIRVVRRPFAYRQALTCRWWAHQPRNCGIYLTDFIDVWHAQDERMPPKVPPKASRYLLERANE